MTTQRDLDALPLLERNRFHLARVWGWPEGVAEETHELQGRFPKWRIWYQRVDDHHPCGPCYTATWNKRHNGNPANSEIHARTGAELAERTTTRQAELEADEERDHQRYRSSLFSSKP
jgi:hypothetical protein